MAIKIKKTTREGDDDNYHVRFRQPSRFDRIRTPAWARRVARDESKGAVVRMGRTPAGNWLVQSVILTPRGIQGKRHARRIARRIQRKIDE